MSGILDLITGPMGQQLISSVAGATGQDTNKTSSVLSMGLPVLMKAMQGNASTPEGAQGLMGALTKHSGLMDNLGGLLGGGIDNSVKEDGGKVLNHILGDKQQGIMEVIGQKVGIDAGTVGSILQTAAPMLLGFLGKQTQESGVSDANGLTSMLGGLLGGSSAVGDQSFIEKMLDSDGDGSVIDDVAGMFLKGGDKEEGGLLGGIAGSLFGK